jgi:GNAT superfamily N-acetyltransferase
MLYDGPWRDAIVAYDLSADDARYALVATLCSAAIRAEDRLGALPFLTQQGDDARADVKRGAVGVLVDSRIEAIAIYQISFSSFNVRHRPKVMKLTICVGREHRSQGMGSALMAHCVTIARQAGADHLIFDDIGCDATTSHLARRFGADLIFVNGDCQAWIDLRPAPAYVTQ